MGMNTFSRRGFRGVEGSIGSKREPEIIVPLREGELVCHEQTADTEETKGKRNKYAPVLDGLNGRGRDPVGFFGRPVGEILRIEVGWRDS